jgi:hypothetical protein
METRGEGGYGRARQDGDDGEQGPHVREEALTFFSLSGAYHRGTTTCTSSSEDMSSEFLRQLATAIGGYRMAAMTAAVDD